MSEPAGIVIVGGGMAGAALALLLRHRGEARVTLVEAVALPEADDAPMPPSFDARSTALAAGTLKAFDEIGVLEPLLEKATDIKTVHVSRQGRPGITRLRAEEEGVPRLGAVTENRWLGRVLLAAMRADPNIEIIAPDRVVALKRLESGHRVTLESGAERDAALLVVADGARSRTRERLGIAAHHDDSGHDALVANVLPGTPHEGMAYERFADRGPVALLPLTEDRMALVWTGARDFIGEMAALDDDAMLEALDGVFGSRMGHFQRIGQRHRYPLILTKAAAQAVPGAVVVGNAAHTLHPVAGQGFNLTMRDLILLADTVAGTDDPGDLARLRYWEEQRVGDQAAIASASRWLGELFRVRFGPFAHGRQLGLVAMDLFGGPRSVFARRAMGL